MGWTKRRIPHEVLRVLLFCVWLWLEELEEHLLLMPACEEIVRHLHYRQPKMPMPMCNVRVNAASKAGC